jgi:hypothetical protein
LRKDRVPPQLTSVRGQYGWLRQRFPGDEVFFQVGRFYEFYGADDALLAQRLGLEPLAENRRGARFGFPLIIARRYARTLLRDGRSILVAAQTEQTWTRIRERRPLWRLVPKRETGMALGGVEEFVNPVATSNRRRLPRPRHTGYAGTAVDRCRVRHRRYLRGH